MKYPHMQFYTGDWLKDPRLSLCHPASRGIWIDLLCAMHELDRSGELRGTTEELSRLARCSTVELEAALTDLQNKSAAEVIQRNGSCVIANRRMKRESVIRAKRAESGKVGGSKRQANREQIPDTDIDSDDGLVKVREFARTEGIGQKDADWFYWKGKGNGWTNGGKPILDWKATLRSWYRAGYLPSQKARMNGSRPSFAPQSTKGVYGHNRLPPPANISDEELERQRKIVRDASEQFKKGIGR